MNWETFFNNNKDNRGIPLISNEAWRTLIKQHPKQEIIDALTDYISNNKIDFPSKQISQSELHKLFKKFAQQSMLDQYKQFDTVLEKVEYRYRYQDQPLGVIDKSHVYNSISNYYQQENRMRCGSNLVDSPWSIWYDTKKLRKMNWHFWRLGTLGRSNIDSSTFRSGFRIGSYTATQFKPSVAKALYEKHQAKNILDTSSGWGDRLAGFYGTPCTELYVGCDPNPEVYETYKKQCVEYEQLLGGTPTLIDEQDHFTCRGIKNVEIWNLPSEDVDWNNYKNKFDFYFTSPPYYETERYADSHYHTQSWYRYPQFNSWKYDFFFPLNRRIWNTLKDHAYMMINIIEPRVARGNRLNLCDDMVDDILTYPGAHYLGKIGMRMQARPHAIVGTPKNSVFVEPIWVFRKNNNGYV